VSCAQPLETGDLQPARHARVLSEGGSDLIKEVLKCRRAIEQVQAGQREEQAPRERGARVA
jgi:hypothetical protein